MPVFGPGIPFGVCRFQGFDFSHDGFFELGMVVHGGILRRGNGLGLLLVSAEKFLQGFIFHCLLVLLVGPGQRHRAASGCFSTFI